MEYGMGLTHTDKDTIAVLQAELATLRAQNAILEQHASALRLAIRECIINHGDYIGSQLFSDMYDLIGGGEALK